VRHALRHSAAQAFVCAPAVEHVLSGHSGALVVLHSSGTDSFVRKTAARAQDSTRLAAQADKQHAFWMHGLPFPKVRAQRLGADGIASFDMNYIPGRSIADAVANGGTFDAAVLVKAVERLVWLFQSGAGGAIAPDLFESKIAQIARAAAATVSDRSLLSQIEACGQMLRGCDWSGIPQSPCHGDLTLENILLTAGKSIAFIDCDQGFASSWWLDFGKLFQDIDGHWCIRALYGAAPVRLLGAVQKLEQLGGRLRGLAAAFDPDLPRRLPQLAALSLFRALPYARDAALMSFLCQRTARVLEA
jgi:aminoglycoside phosphotransferase (APT) family kinase protein